MLVPSPLALTIGFVSLDRPFAWPARLIRLQASLGDISKALRRVDFATASAYDLPVIERFVKQVLKAVQQEPKLAEDGAKSGSYAGNSV